MEVPVSTPVTVLLQTDGMDYDEKGRVIFNQRALEAQPRLVRVLNALLDAPCKRWFPLDRDALLRTAAARSGINLDLHGDADFIEGLDVYLESLRTEATLTAVGRFFMTETVLRYIVSRLKLEQLLARHGDEISLASHAN